jgi:RHS repeat-associated protein
MPLATNYTAIAADSLGRHSTNTVTVDILTNNTSFQYDGNGNLTSDGLRSFSYDGENQLIQVMMTNQWLSQFSYDGKMRRRIRQEYTWQSGAWVQTNEVYYVYDGNVVIQERSANNLPAITYTRGKDLSGSLEGAGGIGGLLSMTLNTQPGPSSSNSMYYHSDGNGNVTTLINGSQSIVAKYLYDAFGNLLSKSGVLADANLYRFSSKEAHLNSGLVYYLYRYYDPNLQRWPNRDPIGEAGGINLYRCVANNPICFVDSDGRSVLVLPGFLAGAGAGTGTATATGTATGIGIGTVLTGAAGVLAGATGIVGGVILAGGYGQGLQSPVTYPGDGSGNPIPISVTGPSVPTSVATQSGAGSQTPIKGPANGSAAADNGDGTGTIRQYGPNGNACADYDFGHDHNGAGDPHGHDWNWNGPKPVRGPARPLKPGE